MRILDQIIPDATGKLQAVGFKKRTGEIYTYEPAKGFLGWLGLNQAKRGDAAELNPVIGIRCQALEKELANLMGEKPHPYMPPTVSVSLGYLMPEKRYKAWLFQSETDLVSVVDLVTAVTNCALPFINSSASLEQLLQLLKSAEYGHVEHVAYRLPLAHAMTGDYKIALELCRQYLSSLNGRSDLAAERYRRFAAALTVSLK